MLFSEPKIPQSQGETDERRAHLSFSALQRAENSSILNERGELASWAEFQCSSASRKFLNEFERLKIKERMQRFQCSSASRKFLNVWRPSVLDDAPEFQCSSASRKFLNRKSRHYPAASAWVSVLFSEPKIPQSEMWRRWQTFPDVSVLFSEPKIPQWRLSLSESN